MITDDAKQLLGRLNEHLTRALDSAVGVAVKRRDPEVALEHLLLTVLESKKMDVALILDYFDVEEGEVRTGLMRHIEQYRSETAGRPSFSSCLLQTVESALLIGSVHHGYDKVRSGTILAAILRDDSLRANEYMRLLRPVHRDTLRESFTDIVNSSVESKPASSSMTADRRKGGSANADGALQRYTVSFTQRAQDGDIDPISRRGEEIRQLTDILTRRRKNNPILMGEAGVGKTAIVEGVARKIITSDVREGLADLEIRSLDVGALRAGASVQGEFEERLKSVLREVRKAQKPTVLFIDEAHTLIGAGGEEGTGDAANMLKPALARGELRAIAATTWSEYAQYIENDAALERRFQLVKVEEPSVEDAAVMLRGIKSAYEDHHGVQITEDAVRAAAELADRYVSGRQLPDKAVDLLDTAAARAKVSQTARPSRLDEVDRRLRELNTRIEGMRRDLESGHSHDHTEVEDLIEKRNEYQNRRAKLEEQWKKERKLVQSLAERRQSAAGGGFPMNGDSVDVEPSSRKGSLDGIMTELEDLRDERPMVHAEVNEQITAEVVSDWTGVPVGSMLEDKAELLLELEDRIGKYVLGQNAAIEEIASTVRTSEVDLKDPDAPLGVFLFVGPSGVGKTETAVQLANQLFGGKRFLTRINMSEYQEKYTASQLKGSPPGYVGYGEGGVLTESVRRQPYSVVLLDEIEKAHRDVMNMFYQVFDKGIMRDGEGREIDFRNTVVVMTSNLAAEKITRIVRDSNERPKADEVREAIRPTLSDHFQPAMLGRIRIVPYFPLDADTMEKISKLKLEEAARRFDSVHDIEFDYEPDVVECIANRCTDREVGARNIDFIVNRTIYPNAAAALIPRLATNENPQRVTLRLGEEGEFTFQFG